MLCMFYHYIVSLLRCLCAFCALVFLGLLLTPPPFMIYNEAEGMTENG